MNVLLSAGEVSGDTVGARLAEEIRRCDPDTRVVGIGGSRMAAADVGLLVDATHAGVVGITEALDALPSLVRVFARMRRQIREDPPQVAVLIGNDVLNVLLARWLRARGVATISFFPPQVWVWRALARPIAGSFDVILTSFPEEQAVYERAVSTARVEYVGHYLTDVLDPVTLETRSQARRMLGIAPECRVVALLPGSRTPEIRRLGPCLLGAARRLVDRDPSLRFISAVADPCFAPEFGRLLDRHRLGEVVTVTRESHLAMRAADVLVAASGTVSLEAALIGVPMVVVYKVSAVTNLVVRACLRLGLFTSDTIGLPNLILGRPVVPELRQQSVSAEAIERETWALLSSPERRRSMTNALDGVRRPLARERTLPRVARLVLAMGASANREVAPSPANIGPSQGAVRLG